MLLDHGRVRVNVQPYRNLKISFLIEVSFKYSVGVCVCVWYFGGLIVLSEQSCTRWAKIDFREVGLKGGSRVSEREMNRAFFALFPF